MNDRASTPGSVATAAATRAGDTVAGPARRLVLCYVEDRCELADLPDGGEVTIGRSREATLVVPSELVSRVHVRLRRAGEAVTIEDLASRNGTWVAGVRIEGETALPPGVAATVGPATVVVAVAGETASPHAARRGAVRGAVLEAFDSFVTGVEMECARARATALPAALAMVRLDGRPTAIAGAQAAILARSRAFDRVAVYGPRELCLLRPNEGGDDAVRAAEALVATIAGIEGARGVVGVACVPEHGADVDTLLAAARDAMRTAWQGGPAVVRAGVRAERGAGAVQGAGGRSGVRAEDDEPIAADPRTRQTLDLAARVAPTLLNVLLLGETGAGKEVVAREVHRRSRRATGPFIAVNCAALPETLLESELFGHERGAFTGATRRKEGWFERATGGTLLLDEIGDLGPDLQVKLLRAIERKAIVRVGGDEELPVDVRLVAATHHDPESAVAAGAFRQDLWYRLSAFVIVVPPLRDRPGDLEPMARRFLAQVAATLGAEVTLGEPALCAMRQYGWPGNVRELRNVIERAAVLVGSGTIAPEHLPAWAAAAAVVALAPGAPADPVNRIAALERAAIVEALEACGGNQTRASRMLGLTRRSLIYRMEKHGLKPKPAGATGEGAE